MHLFRASIILTAVATVSMWVLADHRVGGQTPAYKAPRFVDGKPNLYGIWQALGNANWDLEAHLAQPGPPQFGALLGTPAGMGVVDGGEILYHPSALATKEENLEMWWTSHPVGKWSTAG